nr:hypothetical protein BGAOJDKN_00094 [Escherichia coli]
MQVFRYVRSNPVLLLHQDIDSHFSFGPPYLPKRNLEQASGTTNLESGW